MTEQLKKPNLEHRVSGIDAKHGLYLHPKGQYYATVGDNSIQIYSIASNTLQEKIKTDCEKPSFVFGDDFIGFSVGFSKFDIYEFRNARIGKFRQRYFFEDAPRLAGYSANTNVFYALEGRQLNSFRLSEKNSDNVKSHERLLCPIKAMAFSVGNSVAYSDGNDIHFQYKAERKPLFGRIPDNTGLADLCFSSNENTLFVAQNKRLKMMTVDVREASIRGFDENLKFVNQAANYLAVGLESGKFFIFYLR